MAYALNDPAQTILLCNWVTRLATKLMTPVRDWEIRWQHASCRGVKIGSDIIVVVRDSSAEIYPRHPFTILRPDQEPQVPCRFNYEESDELEMLPVTYATDAATLMSSFVGDAAIYIHPVLSATSNRIAVCARVISLIGIARSNGPPSDPSIPYSVVTAKPYPDSPHPPSSESSSPSHTAPPSPTRTTPSPTHTQSHPLPSPNEPAQFSQGQVAQQPLPPSERYKFVFHVHALRPQHPHLAYGMIVTGPNGRCVMLASNTSSIGGPNQPRQHLFKYKHPGNSEMNQILQTRPTGAPRPAGASPHPAPVQPPIPNTPPPPQAQVQLPALPLHPLLNASAYTPPPRQDPFGPLLPLMQPNARLDVLRGMTHLWYTHETADYTMVAWEESSGTILISSGRGDVVVLECARPATAPLGSSSWHQE